MPEIRPISERIDLSYVRRRRWPGTWTWALALTAVAVVLVLGAGFELFARVEGVYAHNVYSSGSMTRAHAMFGHHCAACHQAKPGDPTSVGFFMPVQDAACLACHETAAASHAADGRLYNGAPRAVDGLAEPVLMSSSCAQCHVEHKGPDHDLNRVADAACVQCHADLARDGYAPGKGPSNATACLAGPGAWAGQAHLRGRVIAPASLGNPAPRGSDRGEGGAQ